MLVSLHGLDSLYRNIRKASSSRRHGECQVLVVSLSNVDSLCATKILLHLFKSDFIQHILIPVSSPLELAKIGEMYLQPGNEVDDRYHIKYLILVNCGAMLDLSQCLSIHPELTVYVFDSHRPVHLSNVFADNQIQVIDDGRLEPFARELWPAFSKIELEYSSDADNQENKSIDINIESAHDLPVGKSDKITEYRSQILEYYRQGDCIGSSVSSFMYALAGQLQKSDSDLLWCCIVGITACFLIENGSEEKYLSDVELLSGEVNRMFSPSSTSSSGSSDSSSSSISRKNLIHEEDELRFLLLHHWSLYQSMFHSPSVSSILQPWTEKGKKKLESFLAKMGISLKQSNQPFTFVDSQARNRIFSQLERYGPEEGLKNLFFPTFIRRYGYKLRVSASDAAYSLQSTLCHPSCISTNQDSSIISSSYVVKNNFHVAFDALDVQNIHLLQLGIQLAKIHTQRLMKTVSYIFNLRVIKNLKRFRLGVLTQPSRGSNRIDHNDIDEITHKYSFSSYQDEELWYTVSSMRSLASFICRSQRSKLPLVLASFSLSRKKYTVIGYADIGHDTRNFAGHSFLEAFRRTAEQLHISIQYDGYGCIFLHMDQHDLSGFIQLLQSFIIASE